MIELHIVVFIFLFVNQQTTLHPQVHSIYGVVCLFHKIYNESNGTVPVLMLLERNETIRGSALYCGLMTNPYMLINNAAP